MLYRIRHFRFHFLFLVIFFLSQCSYNEYRTPDKTMPTSNDYFAFIYMMNALLERMKPFEEIEKNFHPSFYVATGNGQKLFNKQEFLQGFYEGYNQNNNSVTIDIKDIKVDDLQEKKGVFTIEYTKNVIKTDQTKTYDNYKETWTIVWENGLLKLSSINVYFDVLSQYNKPI